MSKVVLVLLVFVCLCGCQASPEHHSTLTLQERSVYVEPLLTAWEKLNRATLARRPTEKEFEELILSLEKAEKAAREWRDAEFGETQH